MTQTFSRPDPYAAEGSAATYPAQGTGAPETLEEMGTALLGIVRQAALAKGVVLPTRQSVYTAPIPADCEQVAVLFTGWNPTPAADAPTICKPWRWIANYSVIITRCSPAVPGKGKALSTVTTDQLMASAKLASDDAEVFLEAMNLLSEVGADVSVVTNSPQGGFQTVELNVPLISGGSFL